MRKFKCSPYGDEVDLDDPKTYEYLGDDDCRRLDDIMFKEIGQALTYMDYFHPDVFPNVQSKDDYMDSGYNQRQRVYKLIETFATNRRDNWGNPLWFKEQIFLLQDETENMC